MTRTTDLFFFSLLMIHSTNELYEGELLFFILFQVKINFGIWWIL